MKPFIDKILYVRYYMMAKSAFLYIYGQHWTTVNYVSPLNLIFVWRKCTSDVCIRKKFMKGLKNKSFFCNLLIRLKIHLDIVKNWLQGNHTEMYLFSKTKKWSSKHGLKHIQTTGYGVHMAYLCKCMNLLQKANFMVYI